MSHQRNENKKINKYNNNEHGSTIGCMLSNKKNRDTIAERMHTKGGKCLRKMKVTWITSFASFLANEIAAPRVLRKQNIFSFKERRIYQRQSTE